MRRIIFLFVVIIAVCWAAARPQQQPRDAHTRWIEQVIANASTIKPGMQRADLDKVFYYRRRALDSYLADLCVP